MTLPSRNRPTRHHAARHLAQALLLAAVTALTPVLAHAQYFGQNKPRYERFDWRAYQTPHFEIYNYLEPEAGGEPAERLRWIAGLSEDWYQLHSRVLRDTLTGRNLMLLYDNHADFQQTNAIQGAIGSGTGGVTEAFKNRVVFPFAMSNHQTDHVLGHELVHAFQYDIVLRGDSTNIRNLQNLPLWMVEGLAEYLSIGRVDAHTAMWMRDAVLHDDVPTIKKLNNPRYFPYRWGQAWWSFVTGLQGDDKIRPLFEATAKFGLDNAVPLVLGMSVDKLSELWVSSVEAEFAPDLEGRRDARVPGKLLIDDDKGGRLNIAPQVSPDGRYVIFLSEKNLFSIDLFLADARNGKIIRQVSSRRRAGHIDDFAYIESAGAWDPKSDRFAYTAVSKGRNVLLVQDVERGKTIAEYKLDGVEAFVNPVWSPDGRTIVVSGLVQGQVDLYGFDVRTGAVTQLTDSYASELLPAFDAAGERIVFAQDRPGTGRLSASQGFDLAVLTLANGEVDVLDGVFPGADNLNPGFDDQGDVVFLSNWDGYRDLYRYETSTGTTYRMTQVATGVSGITAYAPAISVSPRRDRIAYTYLADGKYAIYSGKREQFLNEPVGEVTVDLAAARLPTVNKRAPLVVDDALAARSTEPEAVALLATQTRGTSPFGKTEDDYAYVPLKNPFKLDFIGGGAGVGTSIGNPGLGTQFGAAGGVNALFSDVLGGKQVFVGAGLNGQIYDFSAQVAYVNRERPLGWGASVSHVPYRGFGFLNNSLVLDTLQLGNGQSIEALRYDLLEQRIFEDRIGGFVDYPFSRVLRAEAGLSYARYSERADINQLYYDGFGRLIFQERERNRDLERPGFGFAGVSAAVVGDNSVFGLASPLAGYRFRVGAEQTFGDLSYLQTTVDGRYYERLRPVTLAVRGVYYGRHGLDGDDNTRLLFPFYVGSQWFVRGLGDQNYLSALGSANNFNFDALVGTSIAVANAEVRLPFTGPERLALINFPFLYTELNAFVDAGLAFNDFATVREYYDQRDAKEGAELQPNDPFASFSRPIVTAGVSVRANVLGALILEPYYARIMNMEGSDWQFGFNIIPGW